MNTVLVYLFPLDASEHFRPHAERWAKGYRQFAAGCSHQVLICASNGSVSREDKQLFEGVNPQWDDSYRGNAWDNGEFQYIARNHDADMMLFMNGRAHFWKENWLKPFVDAFVKFGEKGLYGNAASFESCPVDPMPWPNPHIRTPCFATSPKVFRKFCYDLSHREHSGYFESGRWNFSEWFRERGLPVKLVTRDGVYDREQWRKPENIFRRGNQSNCLVWDKHHQEYFNADHATKKAMEESAGRADVKLTT